MFTSCISENEPKGADLGIGDRVPEFSVVMNDGRVISTSDIMGKTGVITFFNTSCPDCRRELPELQKAYDEYHDSGDIVFVLIAREESASEISAYWEEAGLTMPYSAQPDRRIYNLFATSGIPRTYIISPEGIITDIYVE